MLLCINKEANTRLLSMQHFRIIWKYSSGL